MARSYEIKQFQEMINAELKTLVTSARRKTVIGLSKVTQGTSKELVTDCFLSWYIDVLLFNFSIRDGKHRVYTYVVSFLQTAETLPVLFF